MNNFDLLIVVDYQNDFITGTLAVSGAENLLLKINKLMKHFHNTVATQDWHPANHSSFKRNGGMWPDHCIAGTWGSDFPVHFDYAKIKAVFRKGFDANVESYSGVCDNEGGLNPLGQYLDCDETPQEKIYICGVATDYCVRSTALDCVEEGYEVILVTDAVASVDPNFDFASLGLKCMTVDEIVDGS